MCISGWLCLVHIVLYHDCLYHSCMYSCFIILIIIAVYIYIYYLYVSMYGVMCVNCSERLQVCVCVCVYMFVCARLRVLCVFGLYECIFGDWVLYLI